MGPSPTTYKLLLLKVASSRASCAGGAAAGDTCAALDRELRTLFTAYVDECESTAVLPWQQLVGMLRHAFEGEGGVTEMRRRLLAAAVGALELFPDAGADDWAQRHRWWMEGLVASAAAASDPALDHGNRALASAHVMFAAVRALGEAAWRDEAGLHDHDARGLARMAAARINLCRKAEATTTRS